MISTSGLTMHPPTAEALRTDLEVLSLEEKQKRTAALKQETGFHSWDELLKAWKDCEPFWPLISESAQDWHKLLSLMSEGHVVCSQSRQRILQPLDEFILTWWIITDPDRLYDTESLLGIQRCSRFVGIDVAQSQILQAYP